jgi:hypothetical protein
MPAMLVIWNWRLFSRIGKLITAGGHVQSAGWERFTQRETARIAAITKATMATSSPSTGEQYPPPGRSCGVHPSVGISFQMASPPPATLVISDLPSSVSNCHGSNVCGAIVNRSPSAISMTRPPSSNASARTTVFRTNSRYAGLRADLGDVRLAQVVRLANTVSRVTMRITPADHSS